MTDEDKVLHLFNKVHGPVGPNFEVSVLYDDWNNIRGVLVCKDKGDLVVSSEYSIIEIIIDAMCMDMGGDK